MTQTTLTVSTVVGGKPITGSATVTIADGVPIKPTDKIQSILDANPSGTTFTFADGLYRPGTLRPKSGSKFFGTRSCVFSGDNTFSIPFSVVPSVEFHGMTFKNYTEAGLKLGSFSLADSVECYLNGYSGIKFDGATSPFVSRAELRDNGHYGFSGPDSVNAQVQNCSVVGNNTSGDPDGGGTKLVRTSGAHILGNVVEDNHGAGIWLDIDNAGFLVDGNFSSDNDLWGIQVEISYNGVVRNNSVTGNGARGIYISSSGGTGLEVSGNVVSYNAESQITLGQEPRGSGNQGLYQTKNVNVHDNWVWGCGRLTEMFQYPNAPMGPNNTWVHNTYHAKSGVLAWRSLVGDKAFAQWQALGFDSTGTVTNDASC